MNFQKEKEDLEGLLFVDVFFLLFLFDDPPFCEPASRCMLDVFDFFATSIMVMGYWLLVIETKSECKFQRTKIQYLTSKRVITIRII